jgi:hypothetical protein
MTISRARLANMRALLDKLQGDPTLKTVVDNARVSTLYVLGHAAEGRPVEGSIQLAFELSEPGRADPEEFAKAIERPGERDPALHGHLRAVGPGSRPAHPKPSN